MCKQGDEVVLTVVATGKRFGVDRCIAPIVAALNAGGIETVASCCGHGHTVGRIMLKGGRELMVVTESQARGVELLIDRDIQGNSVSARREPA